MNLPEESTWSGLGLGERSTDRHSCRVNDVEPIGKPEQVAERRLQADLIPRLPTCSDHTRFDLDTERLSPIGSFSPGRLSTLDSRPPPAHRQTSTALKPVARKTLAR